LYEITKEDVMSQEQKDETPRKSRVGKIVYSKLQHYKVSKYYRQGVKQDIQAYRETLRSKAERVLPENTPNRIWGIKCSVVKYKIPPLEIRKQRRIDFENTRIQFLSYLAEKKADELLAAGITKAQINGMKRGFTPKGYNTHHIVPIHGGGSNKFSNLCLIKNNPFHEDIHQKIINPQLRGLEEGVEFDVKVPQLPSASVFAPPAKMLEQAKEIAAKRIAYRAEKARQKKIKEDALKGQKTIEFPEDKKEVDSGDKKQPESKKTYPKRYPYYKKTSKRYPAKKDSGQLRLDMLHSANSSKRYA